MIPFATIYALSEPGKQRTLDNARYIGKTIWTLQDRLNAHFWHRNHADTYKDRWIRQLWSSGLKPVIWPVGFCSVEAGSALEMRFIKALKGRAKLTNLTDGGEGLLGYTHRPETVAKIVKANRGKKRSPEFCAAIRARVISKETRQRMSAAGLGRKIPAEVVRKMALSMKAKGYRRSESAKAYLVKLYSIPVLCVETQHIYPSSKVAGIALGRKNGGVQIRSAIRRKGMAYGYHWQEVKP